MTPTWELDEWQIESWCHTCIYGPLEKEILKYVNADYLGALIVEIRVKLEEKMSPLERDSLD